MTLLEDLVSAWENGKNVAVVDSKLWQHTFPLWVLNAFPGLISDDDADDDDDDANSCDLDTRIKGEMIGLF